MMTLDPSHQHRLAHLLTPKTPCEIIYWSNIVRKRHSKAPSPRSPKSPKQGTRTRRRKSGELERSEREKRRLAKPSLTASGAWKLCYSRLTNGIANQRGSGRKCGLGPPPRNRDVMIETLGYEVDRGLHPGVGHGHLQEAVHRETTPMGKIDMVRDLGETWTESRLRGDGSQLTEGL